MSDNCGLIFMLEIFNNSFKYMWSSSVTSMQGFIFLKSSDCVDVGILLRNQDVGSQFFVGGLTFYTINEKLFKLDRECKHNLTLARQGDDHAIYK